MIRLDLQSPVPLYDQIKAGLRGLVARGLLRPGDPAPSIRALAAELKVNPNTVARAFRELTLEGFFEAKRGEGNVIAAGALRQAKDGLSGVRADLKESLRLARRSGLAWSDVEALVREARREEP
jgi:GntR family transcriptional regulator